MGARHCEVCDKQIKSAKEQYACYGGSYYCSEACYDSLFVACTICGQKNMTCLQNAKHPYIFKAPLELACDQCLQKKHKVGIVCISF